VASAQAVLTAAAPFDSLAPGALSDQLEAQIEAQSGLPPASVKALKGFYDAMIKGGNLPKDVSFQDWMFGKGDSAKGHNWTSLGMVGGGEHNGYTTMETNLTAVDKLLAGDVLAAVFGGGIKGPALDQLVAAQNTAKAETQAQYIAAKYGIPENLVTEALAVWQTTHGFLGRSFESFLSGTMKGFPLGLQPIPPGDPKTNTQNMFNRLQMWTTAMSKQKDGHPDLTKLSQLARDVSAKYPGIIDDPSIPPPPLAPVAQVAAYCDDGSKPVSLEMMQANIDAADDELQNLNAVGEIQQMRLQSLTDQRAKVIETLSNILKKEGDLLKAISDNVRG